LQEGRRTGPGHQCGEGADPGGRTERGQGHGVGLRTLAAPQALRHHHTDAGADDAEQDEEHAHHVVGQGEGRSRGIAQARGQNGADDADADTQAQLDEQRRGHAEQARGHGGGRRAVAGPCVRQLHCAWRRH
jgi:hypothetical protein